MRTIARISLLTLPVLLTLPAGCDRATQPEFTVRPPEPQNSVAYLKSLCDGKSSVAIAQDITIRGFVTANDLYGEFHRTIVVEDASGGIAIAAEGSPQTSIRSASWRPYAATALRCATTAGKSSWERHPATAAQGAFRAKSWRGTSAPNRPAARHPPHSSLRSTPSRPGTSTHASVSTTCVSPTPGKPGATPTRRRAAPSPPSARSSTPGAGPSPCGPPRPASTQRSLCPRAQAP